MLRHESTGGTTVRGQKVVTATPLSVV